MTDIDHIPVSLEPPLRERAPGNGGNRPLSWRRSLALVGVLAGGVAIGAGGYAVAAAGFDQLGWQRGAHLAFVQHVVAHALDTVGADAAQEAKAHDIIAIKFAEVAPDPRQHEAMRKQALELLGAPTIDRAAVEKLRAEAVASFDAKSKEIVAGVLDIADLLTPPQRAQLAAQVEGMAEHGPMGAWEGARHGRPMDDGPGDGPDNGPDKD